ISGRHYGIAVIFESLGAYMALKTLHETWLRESTRVVLGEKQQQSFTVLLDCLMDTQGKMNVTAVKTADGVVLRHFADSLSLCDIPA
ncbi:MAG TPA: hypothetical protein DCY74_08335, partial [Clostridiales bacterium]|nr:hypothetical protein [Clostridiales bacterium]